jgi:peptide/nickel transport system substrate-binding protein
MPQASTPNLDANHGARTTAQIVAHFYDYPFGWDNALTSKEQMIESWSMTSDALEYTFTLRAGQTFHDGSPVTSEDLMATVERWRHSVSASMPKRLWDLAGEPAMEKVDNLSFKLKLNKPFGLWINYWAGNPAFVMPKEIAESLEEADINTDYIGSGPFKFSAWVPGSRVVLERYDGYNSRTDPKDGAAGERLVHVDTLEYMEVPDPASRLAALQTKQGDFSEAIPNDFYEVLQDMSGVRVEVVDGWAIPFLATNKLHPPLNNPKSRLALVAATDPEIYLRAAYGPPELWTTCPDLFMCSGQWPSKVGQEVYEAPVDMVLAQQLWDEAVAETGFEGEMVLLTNTDFADFYAAALVTKEILENLGNEVEFFVTDWAGVISRKVGQVETLPAEGGWHFYQSWGEAWDPIQDSRLGTSWNGGWHNEEGQALIEQFASAKSPAEAQAIVDELQRIFWYEDPAVIPYGNFSFLIAMQDDLRGYVPHKRIMLDAVWLDR